ncbi:MAG TPA: sigma-54 dependent transcriptional regulator [Candidatus Binatia bacterium]|nr:sigma-54 dependent transcriptional regulator [Candidatus Binatia bacterium]
MARILVVDDDSVTCRLLADVFGEDGFTVVGDTNPERALAHVADEPVDLAILDVQMPEMDGLSLLRGLRERMPDLPVIIMTAFGSIDTAVEAIASGAVDYVSKPMDVDEIRATVRRALGRHAEAQAALPVADETLGRVVGRSPAMVEVYKTVARVAPGPSTVLILGESGTGKELIARAIHENSPRRKQRFVAVDCGALTETLLESELFGHVRGAFTGAVADVPGLFAEADGGTIFLDEIGDVSGALQAKLLRVLQEHQIRPVGGSAWRTVDVRVIAATNRDLAAAVETGRFREDLYYRLKVVTVDLPPLRERREDVPLLVDHLVRRAARELRKTVVGVSEAALTRLRTYDWPGNVRELAHVLERAVALAHQDVLTVDDLPTELRESSAAPASAAPVDRPTLAELKRRYVERVLQENGGNVSRAAQVLGVDRRSLYRMLQRYGLAPRGSSG